MGLNLQCFKIILPHLKGNVLSLSYPDLVFSNQELFDLTGFTSEKETYFGGWHGKDYKLPETEEVFKRLGVNLTCVDIHPSRGVEKVVDLNFPQTLGLFDLVIDPGTTEHCANIYQAMINAASSVKTDGVIFHQTPLTQLNHGFFCPQPTFYHDFYTQNNWDELCSVVVFDGKVYAAPKTGRFKAPAESYGVYMYKRGLISDFKPPTQTKYLKNPDLK